MGAVSRQDLRGGCPRRRAGSLKKRLIPPNKYFFRFVAAANKQILPRKVKEDVVPRLFLVVRFNKAYFLAAFFRRHLFDRCMQLIPSHDAQPFLNFVALSHSNPAENPFRVVLQIVPVERVPRTKKESPRLDRISNMSDNQ